MITISHEDSAMEMAQKIYNNFEPGQSCTIIGYIEVEDGSIELKEKGIYCAPFGPTYIRFVTHLGFDETALQAFTERISE